MSTTTTTRVLTNNEIVRVYRSLIRKGRDELKITNFEYFRFRLNNAFKQPVSDSYEKFRKFQDAEYLLNHKLGGML